LIAAFELYTLLNSEDLGGFFENNKIIIRFPENPLNSKIVKFEFSF
jgi:hypothetical protein